MKSKGMVFARFLSVLLTLVFAITICSTTAFAQSKPKVIIDSKGNKTTITTSERVEGDTKISKIEIHTVSADGNTREYDDTTITTTVTENGYSITEYRDVLKVRYEPKTDTHHVSRSTTTSTYEQSRVTS